MSLSRHQMARAACLHSACLTGDDSRGWAMFVGEPVRRRRVACHLRGAKFLRAAGNVHGGGQRRGRRLFLIRNVVGPRWQSVWSRLLRLRHCRNSEAHRECAHERAFPCMAGLHIKCPLDAQLARSGGHITDKCRVATQVNPKSAFAASRSYPNHANRRYDSRNTSHTVLNRFDISI